MTEMLVATDSVNGVTPGRIEGGAFGVTPDGAATYTLPLWVPAGRNGIQPELSLHYNSRGGNGLLGVGWTLSGLPKITRGRKTIADDGAEGPALFDKSDPFYLDGERLVLVSGTHGVDNAEYRTKHETFTKIILHDVDSAPDGHILGPTWFEAFHKDGRIFTFGGIGGGDLGSRFEGMAQRVQAVPLPGASDKQTQDSVIVSTWMVRHGWALQGVRDRSGNMLIVYYDGYPFQLGAPPPPRDFVPTRIEYTGSQADGTPALRTVDLVWEDRLDPQDRMMTGLRIPTKKRLQSLVMSGPDPTVADPTNVGVLRTYLFAYQNNSVSGRSLLTSLQEVDKFGVAKGSHTFGWELGQSTFRQIDTGVSDVKATPQGRSPLPGRLRVADFDGDGRDDILYVPASAPDRFFILRSDPSSPTGFSAPVDTGIAVPRDSINGRVYVYLDPSNGFTNILVRDDAVIGSETYRFYQTFTNPVTGAFTVAPGAPQPFSGPVDGPVEIVDLDGDALPDLLHGFTGGAQPLWYVRPNLGGNLNYGNEQLVLARSFPLDHMAANIDGGSATALLIDDSGATGGDARYSVVRIKRPGGVVTSTVELSTLLRDQNYVFGDFTGTGLPSAFSLGNAALTDATLVENLGGIFGPPIPVIVNLRPPPSNFVPSLRLFDWSQDGRAEILARTRSITQLNEPMNAFRWNGAGFSQTVLPFTHTWNMQFPDQFELFEVFDWDGNGLDDVVMFSDGQLRVFVREGNKADAIISITDGLGARTTVQYKPISDPTVHSPSDGYIYAFPMRGAKAKIWVVAQHAEDDGIGGVNTYQLSYTGGVEDVTGLGFLGFSYRRVLHVETGITSETSYSPSYPAYLGIYPMLGLPTLEVTTTPLGNGVQNVARTNTTYTCVGPFWNSIPSFVYPNTIIEDYFETKNGVPTMPVRRRTVTQNIDAYGNVATYGETWSDGNKYTSISHYSNDPATWLVGKLVDITEQSAVPSGVAQTRRRAYEYDAQGLLTREIIEPGPKGPNGYLPLGPQPDNVKTLYRTFDRYPNGNVYTITEEEFTGPTGDKRITTFIYDDLEHLLPVEVDDVLSHRLRGAYHPGLGVQVTFEDVNGVKLQRQYDGFGRLRQDSPPDGNTVTVHYVAFGAGQRVMTSFASGQKVFVDSDALGRVVTETRYERDDGAQVVRDRKYDALGRTVGVSLPRFATTTPVFDVYAYDALGRQTLRVGANGTTLSTVYQGVWAITKDGNANIVARRVDDLDRIVFTTDRDAALVGQTPGPQGMTFDYLPFSVLGNVTDIAGNVIKRKIDRLGRVIDLQDPDLGHREYAYNALGEIVQETKGNAQIVTHHHDVTGRLYWIEDPVDGDVKYTWDTAPNGIGKVAQVDAPASDVRTSYAYDAIGRRTATTWAIGADAYTTTRGFDSVGRLSTVVYPAVQALKPFSLSYQYGNYGQLLSATETGKEKPYWRWLGSDASGHFLQAELGNGVSDELVEDAGRPGALKLVRTTDAGGQLLRNITYAFDSNMNLKSRLDKVLGTRETFEYGVTNRLKRWTWKGTAGIRRVRWDYDDIGNIDKRAVEAGPGSDLTYTYGTASPPHAVTATNLGTYQYDAKGNQIGAPGRTVTFGRGDLPTRIQQAGTAQPKAIDITYDGERARVRVVDQLGAVTIDAVDGLYEYRRPNGKPGPDGEHVFLIRVLGRIVARRIWTLIKKRRRGDTLEYLHADHQGSVGLVTGSTGKAVETLRYDPYGKRVNIADPAKKLGPRKTDLHTGYTEQEHLDSWLLIDMKGRVYDPTVGKFVSADPFVPDPLNPQAWNRYAYVLNNPLTLRDPSGFDDDDDSSEDDTQPAVDHGRYWSLVTAPSHASDATVTVVGNKTVIQFNTGDTIVGQVPRGPSTSVATAPPPTAVAPPPPPPPPPPKGDDGQGGAALSGLPTNAGITQGNRGAANAPQREPANVARTPAEQQAKDLLNRGPFGKPGHRVQASAWDTIKSRTTDNFHITNKALFGNIVGKGAVKVIGIPLAAAISKDVGLISPLQALKSLFGSGLSPAGSYAGLGVVDTVLSAAANWALKTALVAAALEAGIGVGSALSAAAETGYDHAADWFDDLVDEGLEAMFSRH